MGDSRRGFSAPIQVAKKSHKVFHGRRAIGSIFEKFLDQLGIFSIPSPQNQNSDEVIHVGDLRTVQAYIPNCSQGFYL